MAASSSSGCTGEVSTDDLIVLSDAAVDDALTARDAAANSIGVGGDTGDVWPASGVPMPGASRTVDGDGMVSIANGYWTVAIPVDAGMTLELAATVRDNGPANTTAPNTVSMSLLCYSATQIVTLGTAVSDATGKVQTLAIASDHVVAAGELLLLRFVPLAPTTPPTFAQMFSQIRSITVTRRKLRTKVIAPNPTGIPPYSVIDVVGSGVGNASENIESSLGMGDHIKAIRVYVTDNTQSGGAVGYNGPTKLVSSLKSYTPAGGAVPTTLATSNVSNGSGTFQVLTMSGLDVAVSGAGSSHAVQTIDNIGVAPAVVWSVEIDYVAAR